MINKLSGYTHSSLKIGGLASGFDTDEIVSKLMAAEKNKADKLDAEKQIYQWQQDRYRDIIGRMIEFKDQYFNVLNRESNMLSFGVTKNVVIDPNKIVDITASSEAKNKSYVINGVTRLASSAEVTSVKKVVGKISGKVDLTSVPLNFSGKGFKVTLDGVTRDIVMVSDYDYVQDFAKDLQTLLDGQFGTGRVKVDLNGGKYLILSSYNSKITVDPMEESDFLSKVGIEDHSQNVVDLDSTPERLFGASTGYKFSINDTEFFFTEDTKISTIIQAVNSSSAGVTMEYSGVTDKFTLSSKQTGASSYVSIKNLSGNFFGEDGVSGIMEGTFRNGTDAVFYLNDDEMTNPIIRSQNTFAIDGVTFSLKGTNVEPIGFSIENDTHGMFETITDFVKDFNRLIETLENTVNEKKHNDYKPLTLEQKENMSENEIKLWEEKAKSGLLRNDSLLINLKNKLRNAISTPVSNVSISLYDLGIKPSADISSFRLEIDDFKLKEWISKDPDQVVRLFSKRCDIDYNADLDLEQRSQRNAEVGFAHKVSDIFADNIRTTRNKNNQKGFLIEKAGIQGDTSLITNVIYKKIEAVEKSISKMNEWLISREEYYWKQFSAMEVALSKLYSQSDWLATQFKVQ